MLTPNSLAIEIGDLLAATDDFLGAADEWAVAVGDDGAQISTITRRVQALTEQSEEVARRIVNRLVTSDIPARRRAAARAAVDLSLHQVALNVVRKVADELEGRERATFLADAARRARDTGMNEVASWAYDELGAGASSLAERRQFDQSIVDVTLAAGDTLAALEAQRRVAESFSVGSVDRRRAMAQVIQLESAHSGPDDLRTMLDDFRRDFPSAPELDDLAATISGALQVRGDALGASAVLDGVQGPKSSLERGYLLLAKGDLDGGRSALLLALTGLPAAEATSVIQLAGLLGRLSPPAGLVLARAGVKAHHGQYLAAARDLSSAAADLDLEEAPTVLAEAARIALEGGEYELAADIHSFLIEEYPDAPEMAEAALALARHRAKRPRGIEEAIRLLEELITNRPNAAVVPDARVELQRLRG
jgi:tetratricopeptide (TPR) repeat protein